MHSPTPSSSSLPSSSSSSSSAAARRGGANQVFIRTPHRPHPEQAAAGPSGSSWQSANNANDDSDDEGDYSGSEDGSEDSRGPPSSVFSRSTTSGSATSYSIATSDAEGLDVEVLSQLSLSPAPSQYSLTDSLRVAAKHVEYGREVNSYSDVYRLAADTDEISRLGPLRFVSYSRIWIERILSLDRQTARLVQGCHGRLHPACQTCFATLKHAGRRRGANRRP